MLAIIPQIRFHGPFPGAAHDEYRPSLRTFYRDDRDWIHPFVSKNRNYRIECVTTRIPSGPGMMHIASQRVVATVQAA
ncbi:hypothetical protein B5V03_01530 [Bradyrhizobium betae]|uniref:Uncharacterized protein n=1 Tax=Bradyrhizobium betae TaxID=244734 RepID=A0A4Q1VNA2_9BRAD|nr:hypothetical protein B5V03_01530 [Bradyrhizobium betae]